MKKILILTVAALAATALIARAENVKEIYVKQCTKCHGAEGKGDTKAGKQMGAADFTDAKLQEKFTDEQMFKVIKEGVKDEKGKIKMKPAEKVTDDEIKALVKLVRSFIFFSLAHSSAGRRCIPWPMLPFLCPQPNGEVGLERVLIRVLFLFFLFSANTPQKISCNSNG